HWSYGAFAFPLVAAVLGSAAGTVPSGWRRFTAVSLVVIVSLLNFSIVTWGTPVFPDQIRRSWGVRETDWVHLGPHPAAERRWPIGNVVADLVQATAASDKKNETVFAFTPRIPYNVLAFTQRQHWPETSIRFAGEGSPYWGAPYPVDQLLESQFLVIRYPLSDACSQPATNIFFSATACFFNNPPQEFSSSHAEAGRYRLPDGGVVELLMRTSPVTVEEIDATLTTLGLEPKYTTRAVLLAASILERDRRPEEAVARLQAGAETGGQPPVTSAGIWSALGMLSLRLGENDAAVEACERAVELAPGHASFFTRLGIVYAASGRIPEAKEALKEAIRLAPEMRWPRQVLEGLEANRG
ncbi:MAG: tetratricopeptide repeat protein, partial [Verrucomicrobiales bacterium]